MPQEQHLLEQLVSWLPVWSQPKHNAPHLKSRKESGRGQTSLEFPCIALKQFHLCLCLRGKDQLYGLFGAWHKWL